MAAKLKIEKREDENCLKPSKWFQTRKFLCEFPIGSYVKLIEQMVSDNFHPPFFLFLAWRPSWLEVRITGQIFGRGPSKDHSSKVWLQLAQWFLRRRFSCEFPLKPFAQ
jgi:hypothetical protein